MFENQYSGGSGICPRPSRPPAMRGRIVVTVKPLGSARKASTSSARTYSLSTNWKPASSGRSPPGQRNCLVASAS
jgi:hypothetical protein